MDNWNKCSNNFGNWPSAITAKIIQPKLLAEKTLKYLKMFF